MRTILFAATALFLTSGPPASAQRRPVSDAAAFSDAADAWITNALWSLEVIPSLAIVVVVEDEVVLARGYGQADVENEIDSDEDVLYYIASSTKSFTALAAAMMEADGRLDLGSSLASHAEDVEFAPEVRAHEVTLRDLLTHTSGVANDGIAHRLTNTGEHDPETLWNLLPLSVPNPAAPLGTFEYVNTGYNILAMFLDRELEKPWQDVLRDEIFAPLGMARTTAYASLPQQEGWPVAASYYWLHPEGPERMYLQKHDDTMHSAGGMLSTANDLGRWLEFHINEGRLDGEQLVDAEIVRSTHARWADVDWDESMFGMDGYGLGWFHGRLHGNALLHHPGVFAGANTQVSFIPEQRIGVAVMTNAGLLRVTELASIWAYEWWLQVDEQEQIATPALEQLAQQQPMIRQRIAEGVDSRAGRESQLARPLAVYTGEYRNERLGTIEIREVDGRLELQHGRVLCSIDPFTHPETGRIELYPGRSGQVVRFEPATGAVASLRLDREVFERVD